MKVRIIKPVWLFEELFIVGQVYDAKKSETGNGVYIDPKEGDGECFISKWEYEIVEEL